jgi:hypothetical protein
MRCILVLAIGIAGCGADDSTFGVTDERFVATMVELRQAAVTAGRDTARFEELRAQTLERQGVSEEDLRAYVETHSGDLRHMAAMWDSVASRLADPVPAPE